MKNNKRFHDFCADALKHWHSAVFDISFSDGKSWIWFCTAIRLCSLVIIRAAEDRLKYKEPQ